MGARIPVPRGYQRRVLDHPTAVQTSTAQIVLEASNLHQSEAVFDRDLRVP
jgi:hypothetical protein